jgi:hypothetical protein
MTLADLLSLIPPPSKPYETGGDRSWSEIERSLGTALPSDYKRFIELYGTGELGGFIWVYNPFSSSRGLNLLVQAPEVLHTWRSKRARYPDREYPHRIYPESTGLFPWAHIDTGAELFWRTSEDPERWTIVVSEARGPEFEKFDGSMTSFLANLLAGKLKSEILPKLSSKDGIGFVPYLG